MQIGKIDQNFLIEENIQLEDDEVMYSCCEEPFEIRGLYKPTEEEPSFHRLPGTVAKNVSPGVFALRVHCAGGRVRFVTDSKTIGIYAKYTDVGRMSHFALSGSSGFDLYVDLGKGERYTHSFMPSYAFKDSFISKYTPWYDGKYEFTLNFPLYSGISALYIILKKGATVEAPRPYRIDKPVVYYGSSITQGGCASRPGNSYQAMIQREFGCDYVNLGFSGNAKGEEAMARYIAGLDMSAFVYDYDYNAPSLEHLKDTHERMFMIIRESHPDIPIICMSRPCFPPQSAEGRREVILQTVANAKARGDENVYFADVPAEIVASGVDGSFAVDGCHPNDLGFFCMAKALSKVMKDIPLFAK